MVESGTDVRMVEGLAERFELEIVARRIREGVEISQEPASEVRIAVGPGSRVGFAAHVAKYLLRHRRAIDCVLVQGYGPASLAANCAARITRNPTFMLVCSPVEIYYRCRLGQPDPHKPFRRRELAALEVAARLNARLGRHYVVLSEHLGEVVRRHGAKCPVSLIPLYGIDTQLFAPPERPKVEYKARLGLPLGGDLIFFSSRVAPEKDSVTLLKAVRALRARGRELWLLHRSGGYRDFLREAKRHEIADRVIATDAVHPHRDLPNDYRASDLCVQASRAEGLGFSPLEALASEVPVVATAVGGLRETVVDGQTGWSYPAGDEIALARCIEAATTDTAEASRRARKGREMVIARFERRLVFDQFEALVNGTMMGTTDGTT
ncbi:MAG: glycosyltransferase family 4 protein [Gemmatimonadales bacterium]